MLDGTAKRGGTASTDCVERLMSHVGLTLALVRSTFPQGVSDEGTLLRVPVGRLSAHVGTPTHVIIAEV